MNDLRQRLLVTFQAEHAEHVGHIRSLLSMLEHLQETGPRPELDEAFRHAHSLKGAARAVDLRTVEGLAHRLETLFSRVRDGLLKLDSRAVAVIQQMLTCSEDCMESMHSPEAPPDWADSVRAMDELLAGGEVTQKPQAPFPAGLSGPSIPNSVDAPAALAQTGMVRVSGENLERLLRSGGQMMAELPKQDEITLQLIAIAEELSETVRKSERIRDGSQKEFRTMSGGIGEYVSLLRSQVQTLSNRLRTVTNAQSQAAWTLRHRGEQLQQDVWEARTISAETMLEGFRKMVIDLGRDSGKSINFSIAGSEVRADRNVLQALKDPVMHILRNAASHGIEVPADRIAKGKPAKGQIGIRVSSERRRLIISVEDDGRGIDLAAVSRVAIRNRILNEAEVASRPPEAIAQLVFHPGFSTAAKVTSVSGRGFGLSVVQETVRRLQGSVRVRLKAEGTSIEISVPLSMSTTHLLLVGCQDQVIGLPAHAVHHLYRLNLKDLETAQGRSLISVNGRRLPIFPLSRALGLANGKSSPQRDVLHVVVIESRGRAAAMAVDSFIGQHELLVKDLGLPLLPRHITGGAVLEGDRVAIVVNPDDLVEMCTETDNAKLQAIQPTVRKAAPTILVVDDSITTRSLERAILEGHGFRVRVAVDGQQGLEMLRDEPADLVLTDLDMPRMDGLGLLSAIRADKNLERIPVIIVTARDEEHLDRGLELGANACIAKGKFDQRELLRTIRELV